MAQMQRILDAAPQPPGVSAPSGSTTPTLPYRRAYHRHRRTRARRGIRRISASLAKYAIMERHRQRPRPCRSPQRLGHPLRNSSDDVPERSTGRTWPHACTYAQRWKRHRRPEIRAYFYITTQPPAFPSFCHVPVYTLCTRGDVAMTETTAADSAALSSRALLFAPFFLRMDRKKEG